MREKAIENKLIIETRKRGGVAIKFVSPSLDGMPDRIVLLPHGHFAFVEVKAPGQEARPLQVARHNLLMELGYKVFVIDSRKQIGGLLDEIQST
jgi:hypothetical protein